MTAIQNSSNGAPGGADPASSALPIPIIPFAAEPARLDELRQALMARAPQVDPNTIMFVRAPLRICPLGAHIDHQLGIVTGMTIDRSILMAFAPTSDSCVTIHSLDFATPVAFDLQDVPPFLSGDWGNYARGAAAALHRRIKLTTGFVGVVGGNMPIGGLSSSAAVTVAYLLAMEALHGGILAAEENVGLCRETENGYIGLNNGILDQSVILFNQHERLTRIDCMAMDVTQAGAPAGMHDAFEIMVVYSGVGKVLVGTDYNNRVAECREAARLLLEAGGEGEQASEATRLRHVRPELFAEYGQQLPPALYRRARHFFGEMARVERGVTAWQQGNLADFGALMTASGESSVNWYESGSPPLISLYEALCAAPGIYGARFSGAGFRGNCIALVDPKKRSEAAEAVHAAYTQAHPEFADVYSIHFCRPGAGVALLDANMAPVVI